MSDVKDKYLLKTKEGKVLTANPKKELRALDTQSSPKKGQCWMVKKEETKMAFYCEYKKGYFVWTADSGKLKLTEIPNIETVNSSYYFERVNVGSGEHYSLRSVSPPNLYICPGKGTSSALELTSDSQQCVLVTHEKI